MNPIYIESSALSAWVLDEPRGLDVHRVLASSGRRYLSRLTVLECQRAIICAPHRGRMVDAVQATDRLTAVRKGVFIVELRARFLEQSGRTFPIEPVRSLDAIHLIVASWLKETRPSLAIASLDDRVRDNASALGITVLP